MNLNLVLWEAAATICLDLTVATVTVPQTVLTLNRIQIFVPSNPRDTITGVCILCIAFSGIRI
jgi:hypothetical protein